MAVPRSSYAAPVPLSDSTEAFFREDVINTLGSVSSALRDLPSWRNVLAYDQLDHRIVFRREPPFAPALAKSLVGQAVRDRDIDLIRRWFEDCEDVVITKQTLIDAARMVAHENAFHPIQEYLLGLVWDGVPRVDRWLEDYCAVVPRSEAHARLVRAVARRFLISCVARAMAPGSKVDTMLILEGAQGLGKSTALATLAGEGRFCDSAIDFASKEACQQIQGVWIYELAELDALFRRETSVIKAFLSRAFDRFRVPYGRAPETVPRSVVFCGTVNHGGYLRDRTGNRRFWVVSCEKQLDVPGLAAARDALWAEALHLYANGEAWHLDAEEEALMGEEHEERLEADPWEEVLVAWTHGGAREGFTMSDVLDAVKVMTHSRNPAVTQRVSQILLRLGYERRKRTARPRTYFYARRPGVPASRRPTELVLTSWAYGSRASSTFLSLPGREEPR
jgi:putative DNA primase/helicase